MFIPLILSGLLYGIFSGLYFASLTLLLYFSTFLGIFDLLMLLTINRENFGKFKQLVQNEERKARFTTNIPSWLVYIALTFFLPFLISLVVSSIILIIRVNY